MQLIGHGPVGMKTTFPVRHIAQRFGRVLQLPVEIGNVAIYFQFCVRQKASAQFHALRARAGEIYQPELDGAEVDQIVE